MANRQLICHKLNGHSEWMMQVFDADNIPELQEDHSGKSVLCIAVIIGDKVSSYYEIGTCVNALIETGKAKLIELVKGGDE